MFNRLFGKEKQTAPERKAAEPSKVEKVDAAIELLEKREAVLEKKIEQELTRAKAFYAKKNTQSALQCMKRKKMLEEQLTSLVNQRQNLETVKFTIENQHMNHEVLQAQMNAKKELQKANKKMDVGKVEQTLDELNEEMDKANQINEALGQPLDTNFVDEDELMAELEGELDLELEGMTIPELETGVPNMPAVPNTKLPAKKMSKEDEDALKMLEAEFA